MNSITELTVSDRLQRVFNNFKKLGWGRFAPTNSVPASAARGRAVPAPDVASTPFEDCDAQAQVAVPVAESESKPVKTASEAVGISLVFSFVVGAGAVCAWTVVQILLMISQAEPLLVRNILWTHQ